MRAISSRQPWAWAISSGHRDHENRRWRPGFRPGERIAIHASRAQWSDDELDAVEASCGVRPPAELDVGAVVALATVLGVVRLEDDGGYWSVVLGDVTQIEPVECRGALGVWTVPPGLLPGL